MPACGLHRGPQPLPGERAGVVLQHRAPRRPAPAAVKYHDVAVRADCDARIPTPQVTHLAGPGELHPEVAGAVLLAVPVEHQPQQAGVVARGRRHPLLVAVQHERQQHLQRLRLAGAVGPAQQQPAVRELEHLLVVLPDVEHARAGEPEPVRHGASSSSNSDGWPPDEPSVIDARTAYRAPAACTRHAPSGSSRTSPAATSTARASASAAAASSR